MLNIRILSVGKIKESFIEAGIEEYVKRLSKFCKLTLISVKDEKIPEKASLKEVEKSKVIEGKRLLDYMDLNSYCIVLDLKGKQGSSEDLAEKLNALGLNGKNRLTFVIGGSCGLSEEVLSQANERMSFSKMTFPHQLMKLILLEQLYRGFKINHNEPYHK